MKRKPLTRILLWAGGIFACLVLVLAVHIYIVTRPKPPGPNTRIMARIDVKQDISPDEANKISGWLYEQKGVDRVMVNPQSDIVIFTFFPVKTNASKIVDDFKSTFHYPAQRILPSQEDLAKGCPAMAQSFTASLFGVFKRIF